MRLVRLEGETPTHFSLALPLRLENGQALVLMLPMEPAATLRGKLSDNVPRPVTHGRVKACVCLRADNAEFETLCWNAWAPVDPHGEFVVEGLPRGESVQLVALSDGYIGASDEPPEFASERDKRVAHNYHMPQAFPLADAVTRVTVRMQPTRKCEVRVVDPRGAPVSGARVGCGIGVLWWNGGSQTYCDNLRRSARELAAPIAARTEPPEGGYPSPFQTVTDSEGRAVIGNLPPGVHDFNVREARTDTPRWARAAGEVEVAPGRDAKVTVTMRPLSTRGPRP